MGVKPARIRFYRFRTGERETYHGFTTVPFLISFFLIYFRINRVVSGKRSGGALNGVLIGAALFSCNRFSKGPNNLPETINYF